MDCVERINYAIELMHTSPKLSKISTQMSGQLCRECGTEMLQGETKAFGVCVDCYTGIESNWHNE